MFTQEELQNILALINRAQIQGQEATAVVILQQKIAGLLKENEKPKVQSDKQSDTPKI